MKQMKVGEAGFTIVELTISVVIISIVVVSMFGLFVTLVNSAVTARRRAAALTLATNQMEYLKSLPYDSLAISGGSFTASSYLPATTTKTVSNLVYTIKTSISYVDDAYDGCGSYPTTALKQTYCRNYPPPAGAPTTDTNPQDYKIVHVAVLNAAGSQLAGVDTQISARVSETASTTGALFVNVVDGNGTAVSGAQITVTNGTVTPTVNVSDATDSNGIAIFYGLQPDSGTDYVITASKSGYSSLSTISASGSLQPTYGSQKILTQQASYASLKLYPQGANSLLLETTNTSGAALGGVKVYLKGGYKKYTATTDTSYYYDNVSPSDNRPTTDASGLAGVTNLVPGSYLFWGDDGSVSCSVSGTTYYLAAALPYGGNNSFSPVAVPTYDAANPPSTTYPYNSVGYLQKVRLMLTTNANFPRVYSVAPYEASAASGLSNVPFTVAGQKLPCSASASSCSTSVKLTQGSSNVSASCTGGSAGTQLSCTANMSGFTAGNVQLTITTSNGTLTLPTTPQGDFNVTP